MPQSISIIVPAFNEAKCLGTTLTRIRESALAFEARGWSTERIVCDNGSTDATAAIAEESGAKVVFEPIRQIARARNRGATEATGDWLLFVDADSSPSPALFEDIVGCMESGSAIGGGCTLRFDAHRWWSRPILALWNGLSRWNRWAAGSLLFAQAAAFRQLGGFDQAFYAGEEIELSKRLNRLAQTEGKSVVILHRHPLVTSGRKLYLHSATPYFRLLGRTLFKPKQTLTDRERCYLWYDGKR